MDDKTYCEREAMMKAALPKLCREAPAFFDGLMERISYALDDGLNQPRTLYALAVNLDGLVNHRLQFLTKEKAEDIFAAVVEANTGELFFVVPEETGSYARRPRAFVDPCTREYVYDHGGRIDEDTGMIYISRMDLPRFDFLSSFKPSGVEIPEGVLTLDLPTTTGCCLIFEGQHFTVTED